MINNNFHIIKGAVTDNPKKICDNDCYENNV